MDPSARGDLAADEDRTDPYAGTLFVAFSPSGVYEVAIDDTTAAGWAGTIIARPARGVDGEEYLVRIDGDDDHRTGWVANAHWVSSPQPSASVLGLQGETPFRPPSQASR
jgi:hypothetical protein